MGAAICGKRMYKATQTKPWVGMKQFLIWNTPPQPRPGTATGLCTCLFPSPLEFLKDNVMKQGVSPPQKPTVLHVTLGYKLTAKASQWLSHYSMKPSQPEMPQPQETFPFQWPLWDKLKDCVLKFLLYFFPLSAVLHCVSKRSRSTWLAGGCQYATLRLVWRGIISRLPEPCTCPPLQKDWNTSLSWFTP